MTARASLVPPAAGAPGAAPTGPARRWATLATSHTRRVAALWALTGALTGVGVLLGLLIPALAPAGAPHPTLHGTAAEAADILGHNIRVLAAPLILAAARWGSGRVTRLIGDAIVLATIAVSPLLVGAAIGRDGGDLLAYLPHLPVEWAALSVAAGAWLAARRSRLATPLLAAYAGVAAALAVFAAIIETVAIPHAI
jgi:hypothetical protein